MPTIVDALLVTLGLDSREFKAGAEQTKHDLEETKEKAKETAEELKKQGERGAEFFDKLKEHAIEFFGIMASVGALVAFTESTIKSRTEMNHLSEQTNMAVEEISKWQSVVTIAGGSAEGFNSSLKALGGSLVSIEKGLPRAQRALVAFKAIGINDLGQGKHVETIDILDRLHEKFSSTKMTMQEAITLGQRVGVTDEAMIRVLKKGGEAYDEMMSKAKALGTTTKEEAEQAEKVEEGMNAMGIAIKKVAEIVVTAALPAINWLSEKFTAVSMWAREHSGVVKVGIAAIATALGVASAGAITFGITSVTAWVTAGLASLLAGAQFLIAGASAAMAWVMATGGLILLIPLIALLIGGLVKLYNHFEGFRNVIGSVFGWAKNYIMTVFSAIWDVIKDVFAAASDAVNIFVGIFAWNGDKIKESWHSLWEHCTAALHMAWMIILFIILSQVTLIIGLFGKLLTAGKAMWVGLREAAMEPLRWIEEKISKIVGMVTKVASMFGKAIVTAAVAVSGGAGAPASASTPSIHTVLAQQGQAQQAAISRNTTNQSNRETHIGQINVQTQATDARGIAQDIGGAVKSSSLVDHADRGMI